MKQIFDFSVAVIIAVASFIPLLILAVLVRIKLGSPVIFIQQRPGLKGKIFKIYKFRTMTDKRNKNGQLLPDNQRITKFGNFLRNSSLDELPEMFNVLKGDMSLVGPRPLLVQYLPLYSKEQSRRHNVKPGITGWAQINGRNALSWDEKFKLDCWYVDHQSFLLDIKIFLLTGYKVFKRDNVAAAGHVTMPAFTGNEHEK